MDIFGLEKSMVELSQNKRKRGLSDLHYVVGNSERNKLLSTQFKGAAKWPAGPVFTLGVLHVKLLFQEAYQKPKRRFH